MRILLALALLTGAHGMADDNLFRIDTKAPILETSPRLWGIFFEEINHSGDGGLYAEMVRNRSFEDNRVPEGCTEEGDFYVSPTGWKLRKGDQAIPKLGWSLVAENAEAAFDLDTSLPLNHASPTCARLTVRSVGDGGRAGVANEGYWGMSVREGAVYDLSVHLRAVDGYQGGITVSLESSDGAATYATADLSAPGGDWSKVSVPLTSTGTDHTARLVLCAEGTGTVFFDLVSLFPRETYKGRANGLRPDLAEMVAALKPAFIRFPGGCIVEGFTPESAWKWEESVGDIALRPGRQNLWGYRASDGFGYHEMLQFAEDIGAEPIVVVNCGITCQGRSPVFQPLDALEPYVQSALDAVEYANGGMDTKWGAERAKNGHPEPFNMKYITIGNENGGPEYARRYRVFAEAFRAKHPEIKLISNDRMPSAPVDLEEHHYYMTPSWFAANGGRYDEYDRALPKVFVSEYAANQDCGKGNLAAAVGESAFMLGMENNSDIVDMAAYAPLFNHEHNREWPVNLIVFDNHRAYGTPSYHAQILFAENRPDELLQVEYPMQSETIALNAGRVGLGTWKTRAEYREIYVSHGGKVLYAWDQGRGLDGWQRYGGDWKVRGDTIVQDDLGENRTIQVGDSSWTDYTLRLKARKIEGEEGFLILFRSKDRGNWHWLNLGGWGNRFHNLETHIRNTRCPGYEQIPGTIETGRWYDIEVEVQGDRVRVALDGNTLFERKILTSQLPGIKANAGRVRETGEYIVKVSNFLDRPWETPVMLEGCDAPLAGTVTVLQSAHRTDENSLDSPEAVLPVTVPFQSEGAAFTHVFPPCSLTIIRAAEK